MKQTNGVTSAVRTVLSVTWPAACLLPFPGGRAGPSTQITSGSAITVATIVRIATRRM